MCYVYVRVCVCLYVFLCGVSLYMCGVCGGLRGGGRSVCVCVYARCREKMTILLPFSE